MIDNARQSSNGFHLCGSMSNNVLYQSHLLQGIETLQICVHVSSRSLAENSSASKLVTCVMIRSTRSRMGTPGHRKGNRADLRYFRKTTKVYHIHSLSAVFRSNPSGSLAPTIVKDETAAFRQPHEVSLSSFHLWPIFRSHFTTCL